MTLREIDEASRDDQKNSQVRRSVMDMNLNIGEEFVKIKNKFAVVGNTVVRGTRILMPEKLRQRPLELAHESQQGIVKTKSRLREKVWWPGIDKDIELYVKSCHMCQVMGTSSRPDPLYRTPLPQGPWEELAIDLCGPFPSGDHIATGLEKEIYAFLMAYRSTPHSVTGESPAKMMFGREIRTKIPEYSMEKTVSPGPEFGRDYRISAQNHDRDWKEKVKKMVRIITQWALGGGTSEEDGQLGGGISEEDGQDYYTMGS
ncbi:uncharacterized protein K02A2.6-like [Mizuhopecten yessoensis]|uniref:uncharacterized protein K02A2.6-like n=1 Tax=Mizuhopecten yessoensis TaxID=6573 RepID=UPI000B457A85|nr:uncharacterized protein K02A2.6-like [Mizuhopecten yessoensis]